MFIFTVICRILIHFFGLSSCQCLPLHATFLVHGYHRAPQAVVALVVQEESRGDYYHWFEECVSLNHIPVAHLHFLHHLRSLISQIIEVMTILQDWFGGNPVTSCF